MPSNLTREAVQAAIDAGDAVVLEALPEPHWAKEHLPGARNLPLDRLDDLAPQLVPEQDARVIVYCANTLCENSRVAAARLEQLGYTQVFTYEDGKQDWIEAGLPVERAAAA